MTASVGQLFGEHGLPVVLEALRALEGKPESVLGDEYRYRQMVADPAWQKLPAPLRAIGRERLQWDKLLLELRQVAVNVHEGHLTMVPGLAARLTVAVDQFFQLGQTAAHRVGHDQHAPADTSPSAQPLAIGVDLGTTYSTIAYVDRDGRPCSIPNATGDRLTPSVILMEDDGVVVGREARMAAAMEPGRVAECAKRDMGCKAYRKPLDGEFIPPEVLSSFILRSLKADAERMLGPVAQAVITVPAYFDEPRRRATMDAGRLAGLQVLDIVNEPTAAAIAYGYQKGFLDTNGEEAGTAPVRLLVYDLGGGTFDVTIVEILPGSFKALATDGDVELGGRDWDEKLLNLVADRFLQEHGQDPRTDPSSQQELWNAVETAKRSLSERTRATLYVTHQGTRGKVTITREEFEEASAALLERTRATTEIVVRQAGLSWSDLDRVLLVGGSTRMPMVKRMLQQLTALPVDRSISPDEAVAHGAALYADLLLNRQGAGTGKTEFAVTNVNSHSLGIVGIDTRTNRRCNRILIAKNTPLPHAVTKTFKTFRDNQRNVKIRILEGESERPEACSQVGTCTIQGLPPALPKGWPVQVTYAYEENGRLQVTAALKGHDAKATAEFARDNSLPEHDLMLWGEVIAERTSAMSL